MKCDIHPRIFYRVIRRLRKTTWEYLGCWSIVYGCCYRGVMSKWEYYKYIPLFFLENSIVFIGLLGLIICSMCFTSKFKSVIFRKTLHFILVFFVRLQEFLRCRSYVPLEQVIGWKYLQKYPIGCLSWDQKGEGSAKREIKH